ncbi:MAG: hypothetical protein ACKVT1_08000 [Dehalococcoidia bacterium]
MAGKLLLPAIPLGRRAPWLLAAVGLALVVFGLATGDRTTLVVGCVGLVGLFVAFPLARLVLPKAEEPPPE